MYVMHRRGFFVPQSSDNQCRAVGHEHFEYKLKLVCSESLDSKGFIVDHVDVNAAVLSDNLIGSCEEMHVEIFKRVRTLFKGIDCILYAYRCDIRPIPEGDAWMSYVKLLRQVGDLQLIKL